LEKRLLLAFVLSLAVFVGWGAFMAKFQPPPVEQTDEEYQTQVTAQNPTDPGSATLATPSGYASSRPQPAGSSRSMTAPVAVNPFPGEEKEIQVDAGKTHYIFSNRGGVLKQILLPRFNNDDGDTINLINNPDNLTSALSLKSDDAEITSILQNAYYEPSTTSIVLGESNPEAILTFTLKHESGLEVLREYKFRYNDYALEIKTRISALPLAAKNLQYQIVLGPEMGGKISSQTDYIVFSGATVFVNNERFEHPLEDLTAPAYHRGDLKWVAFQNKYFGSALVPVQGTKEGWFIKKKIRFLSDLNTNRFNRRLPLRIFFMQARKNSKFWKRRATTWFA
jgi:YidC/Oxa1 family membrane protein insertase